MEGLLGKKVGMTQIFTEDGTAVPVTVIQAGPCLVVQRKATPKDGYEAVQLGLVEDRPPKHTNLPTSGHFKAAGVTPTRRLNEFRIDSAAEWKAGDEVKCSLFSVDDYVDIIGTSKGKGFQGVMRRHGHGGGRATHGSMFHRAPGSIGQSSDPSRVYPGTKLPGQMGGKRTTVKNLRIVKVDEERNLLFVRGAVPGPKQGYLTIRRAKRG
jgi:large subunit ribosomal protein L3